MNYVYLDRMIFVAVNKIYNLLFKNWLCVSSRASRQEYILRVLMFFVIGNVAVYLEHIDKYLPQTPFNVICMLMVVFIMLIVLALSLMQIFLVTHRRLHDLNASGWWQLITFIPFGQILMIGFIFFKGTPGPNKYGPPPEY